ncbi:hypothetical protein HID58_043984 [Brassica napus]|uniref:Reverse transcriptase zinc-binding domain-containing protein n=1 Tax=Brassica napus TaxID=3708 RepID=A0ABQ8BI27_BRANA|nr:hypothetical protein HID58_043984 [Brassica napus]
MVWRNTGNNPDPSLLRGYAKVEALSISKLNEFIIAAEPQEIEFVRTGRVTGIKMDKAWCYVSFSRCARSSKELTHLLLACPATTQALLECSGILDHLYRMEMSIADNTDEGLFVAFDGEMKKLHNMRL